MTSVVKLCQNDLDAQNDLDVQLEARPVQELQLVYNFYLGVLTPQRLRRLTEVAQRPRRWTAAAARPS